MGVKPWLRINADYLLDGAVRETGFAWAWPPILTAMKRASTFGRLIDTDLTDRVLFEIAQVPGCPPGRSFAIRDAYISVGLLVPYDGEGGGWTAPGWETYQEDPTRSDRQSRYREANRERLAEAERNRRAAARGDGVGTRGDVATGRGDGVAPVVTPDRTVPYRTHEPQVVDPSSVVEEPPAASPSAAAAEPEGSPRALKLQAQAQAVFEYWVATFNKRGVAAKPSSAAGKKRMGHVTGRLRDGYTVDQLKQAIDGCARSPWHRGQNPDGKVYDDLELICRPDKVDRFIAETTSAAPRPVAAAHQPGTRRPHHAAGLYEANGATPPPADELPPGAM